MEVFVILSPNEKCKLYYEKNKDRVLARKKIWYEANHEEIKQKKREAYHKDKKKYLEATKKYSDKNKFTAKFRYTRAKAAASHRELNWNISLEEYSNLIQQNCYYCSTSLNSEIGTGLDRINNDFGYEVVNVLPCCGSCNQIRGNNLTVEETKIAITAVLNYRKQKEQTNG